MAPELLYASHYNLDEIKKMLDQNTDLFGFLPKKAVLVSISKGELYIVRTDVIVGFCRFHVRLDKRTTVYELFVCPDRRRMGIGRMLIGAMKRPVLAKCPVQYESNQFYQALSFVLLRVEPGKKRQLNVWWLDD